MPRLVIDTDPGVDDAQAIMLAAAYPDTQIEAITTVAGNVSLDKTTANACTVLDALGLATPVYAGCPSALLGAMHDASYVHGDDGLGDAGFEPSARPVEQEHAVMALIRLANEAPGELTLVALGPLTNVAMATRLDPDLPTKYRALVCMGGAIRGMGNTPNPSAEFNVYSDPEAAQIVYQSWPDPLLIPWETVVDHALDENGLDELLAVQSPRADFFRAITGKTLAFIQQRLGGRQLFAADSLAMAAALEPDSIQRIEHRHVQVALGEGHTRGQTTVDWFRTTDGKPNVRMVLSFDPERWRQLLLASVT